MIHPQTGINLRVKGVLLMSPSWSRASTLFPHYAFQMAAVILVRFLLSYLGYWGNLGIKCACCKVRIDIQLLPWAAQTMMDIKETQRVKNIDSE